VSAGNVLFTLLGFAGMYAIASILYLLVMSQEIMRGPVAPAKH
jgi:cytochrome bd-type quinol oxidase subunit 1